MNRLIEIDSENNIIDFILKISSIQEDAPRKAEHIIMMKYFEDETPLNDISYTMSDFSMFGYIDANLQREMEYQELRDIVDILEEAYVSEGEKLKGRAFLINGIHIMVI